MAHQRACEALGAVVQAASARQLLSALSRTQRVTSRVTRRAAIVRSLHSPSFSPTPTSKSSSFRSLEVKRPAFTHISRRCLASAEPSAAEPSADAPAAASRRGRRPILQVFPDESLENLTVLPVEKEDKAWAGVAMLDRGDEEGVLLRQAILLGGDVGFLLLFAAFGRSNHSEATGLLEIFGTAWPFILGWTAAGYLLDGYGKDARGSDAKAAAIAGLKVWAVGVPVGLAVRGLSKGYVPPTPFIIVALTTTLVLLVGWRALVTKTAAAPTIPGKPRTKQGNPFEFLQLLMSLTKRW